MKILGIDTSGRIASVAVCEDDCVLAQTTIMTKLTHSQVILPLVERVISDAGLMLSDLDGFAVANGPGSYTGLRIGISAVKAMCFSLSKECAGVSTLHSLAFNCIDTKGIIISIMKARPEIAYWSAFKSDGNTLTRISEDTVTEISELEAFVNTIDDDIILVGDYSLFCYDNLFKDNKNVRVAGAALRLQQASSLCFLAIQGAAGFSPPDSLDASYLQITKAEKDNYLKSKA